MTLRPHIEAKKTRIYPVFTMLCDTPDFREFLDLSHYLFTSIAENRRKRGKAMTHVSE